MAKFIQKAIKHPGALTAAAKRHGLTTLQEAERESHSSNPHIRARGNLGKRLIHGDLHNKTIEDSNGSQIHYLDFPNADNDELYAQDYQLDQLGRPAQDHVIDLGPVNKLVSRYDRQED